MVVRWVQTKYCFCGWRVHLSMKASAEPVPPRIPTTTMAFETRRPLTPSGPLHPQEGGFDPINVAIVVQRNIDGVIGRKVDRKASRKTGRKVRRKVSMKTGR